MYLFAQEIAKGQLKVFTDKKNSWLFSHVPFIKKCRGRSRVLGTQQTVTGKKLLNTTGTTPLIKEKCIFVHC